MTNELILQELEALAQRMEINLSRVNLEGRPGGLCIIKGERRLILDRTLDVREQVEVLSKAFGKLPLDDIYLKPAVRQAIDSQTDAWV